MQFLFITLVLLGFRANCQTWPSPAEPAESVLAGFAQTLKEDPEAYRLAKALIESGLRGMLIKGQVPGRIDQPAYYFQITFMPARFISSKYWAFLQDSKLNSRVRESAFFETSRLRLLLKAGDRGYFITKDRFDDPDPNQVFIDHSFIVLSPASDSAVLLKEQLQSISNAARIGWSINHDLLTLVPQQSMRIHLIRFAVELSSYAVAIRELHNFGQKSFVMNPNSLIVTRKRFSRDMRIKRADDLRAQFNTRFARPAELALRALHKHRSADELAAIYIAFVRFVDPKDFAPLGLDPTNNPLVSRINCIAPLIPPIYGKTLRHR